ncbi:MAG: malonyl-CoA decarboxylase [Rhizobiaceae bacterium]|jgi:malonyl-CoA decarboxylase|nr:malonyl-CoA decarboxylase [Rhizobiaceae bacterium]
MTSSGFFHDILSSVFDKRFTLRRIADERPIEELCRELLTSRGEVSASRLGQLVLDRFDTLDEEGQHQFFCFLTDELDLQTEEVASAAKSYEEERTSENFEKLMQAAEPLRQVLLRRLNQVPNATVRLVRMREALLKLSKKDSSLKRTDVDFQHLFASWFNRGFLVLRRIDWQSPAQILQKIIQYEAVHEIDDWDDLQRRVHPEDRHCYAFFHPSMPDEPLIFVEVALCDSVPASVQEILSDNRDVLEQELANTAVFYSISNCQKGLAGISFGNSLIKQVVQDLKAELPEISTFITLSPLPRFNRWLEENDLLSEEHTDDELKVLAARYLHEPKDRNGNPLDPVAKFHLNNGAIIHQLHANADISAKGKQQSSGVMVNYLYDLKSVEQNHEEYAERQNIVVSKAISNLLAKSKTKQKAGA